MNDVLEIIDLHAEVEGKEILKGINIAIPKGEIHAIMGPNGSGKSTLSNVIMGNPIYKVTSGKILWKGENIIPLSPDERAKRGLFLAFQYPIAIPGVTVHNFVRMALNSRLKGTSNGNTPDTKKILPLREFLKKLKEKVEILKLDESFIKRFVNDGFSGGEKKRVEILQMLMLQPEMAILDETDSGLDIDALKIISEGINQIAGPHIGILIITHYQRILEYVKPKKVHIILNGTIVLSGNADLPYELEKKGYEWIRKEFAEKDDEIKR